MSQSSLLLSQEDVLARLIHNLNYGDGVVVLSGTEGSGKTTVALSTFEKLDTYNHALITCPKQATLAEIRYKIVTQFFRDPLFDTDEIMTDTLIRLSNGRSQSMLLLLDDADLLSDDILQEILVLSHLQSHGIRLRLMIVVNEQNLQEFKKRLPPKYQSMMLNFVLPSLSYKERCDLYWRLLERTTKKPVVSVELIQSYLSRQSGKPAEVASLLQEVLHNPESLQDQNNWLMMVMLGLFILVLFILIGFWMWSSDGNEVYIPSELPTVVAKVETRLEDQQSPVLIHVEPLKKKHPIEALPSK
ncbi:MAG: AAA family ATPase [Shewanellaceae bacterium]|nr:AAA family ATPase [Shewanellaceae bacterium]